MLKKLIFLIIFLFVSVTDVLASNEFLTDAEVEYAFDTTGRATVTHQIYLENAFPTIYATSYNFNINNIKADNIKVFEKDNEISSEIVGSDLNRVIRINFIEEVIGKGQKREFRIVYETSDLAERTGEVWEISIPKLSEPSEFRAYRVTAIVPDGFGNLAYLSPDASSVTKLDSETKYVFLKEDLLNSGIQAGFGLFQVFSFDLKYHIENPLNQNAETVIPVPPDTAFQKVYLTNIVPKPIEITRDIDGNWLAKYVLTSRQRVDIEATGYVQIYSKERPFSIPTNEELVTNLQPTSYWETDNPEIKGLTQTVHTPKEIYDFVLEKLNYDYQRVAPNVQRMGAVGALNNPNSAICMEFTDLFIALARAAGIPAREVNGYAYTENPEIQPLSLVADVLHSWPEYWDPQRNAWIPVDPTWGDTTGGVDFFDKLDLRHITFVNHGADPLKPYAPGSYKLGPNPQKDVFVSFAKLPDYTTEYINLKAETKERIPLIKNFVQVSVYNPGPKAEYDLKPKIYFDGTLTDQNELIDYILPFSSHKFNINIPVSFLGITTPDKVSVKVKNESIEIPSYKTTAIINSLTLLLLILLIFTAIFILIFKRHTIKAAKSYLFNYVENKIKNNRSEKP
jgi:transglutaminase-like putative cysteine protease